MSDPQTGESFLQFKNSFSYGSRSDLSFKFLKNLSEADAARFIQELFHQLGDMLDDGDPQTVVESIVQWQRDAYAHATTAWSYADGPFTPLTKPLSATRLVLITSSGHFVEGDDPAPLGIIGMTQEQAIEHIDDFLKETPVLSRIPLDTPRERLCVRHPGYDIRGAQTDRNVALPLDRLTELAGEGRVGELAPVAYSFVGACAQTPLLKRSGPQWVQEWSAAQVEAALLVPV